MALSGGITLDKNQRMIEIARNQAIMSAGKKFITLKLIDFTKNRIQGAIVLHSIPYEDPETRLTKFHFEERGGPIEFQLDELNMGMYAHMLDCPHNREFLASMYGSGFWQIEDEKIEAEIKEKAEKIRQNMANKAPVGKKETEADMPDEVLNEKLARLQKEKADRDLRKAKLTGKISKPGVRQPQQKQQETELHETNEAGDQKKEETDKPQESGEGKESETPSSKKENDHPSGKKGGKNKRELVTEE